MVKSTPGSSVASVLDEKRLFTKIVTSVTFYRSQASYTQIILSFSSSSASNMVKSLTPRLSLLFCLPEMGQVT